MRAIFLSLAATAFFIPTVASAQCTTPLNHICPFFNLGPSGTGQFLYLANRHTGTTCFEAELAIFEGGLGAEAACIGLCDCTSCAPLGQEDDSPTAAPETGKGGDFFSVPLPIEPKFNFDPNGDGMNRNGKSSSFGKPFFLKYCKKGNCGDGEMYIKVFPFQYFAKYPGGGNQMMCSVVAFGFQCEKPKDAADIAMSIGTITKASATLNDGTKRGIPNLLQIECGQLGVTVRVENSDDWLP